MSFEVIAGSVVGAVGTIVAAWIAARAATATKTVRAEWGAAVPTPSVAPLAPPTTVAALGALPFTNSIGMRFVRIEPGEFLMGSPKGELKRRPEETQHRVGITKAFMLGVHPVTRAQFRAFAQEAKYKTEAEKANEAATWLSPGLAQTDEHPVVCVSWNDAREFNHWLSLKEGKSYRLPTEAEWEYACRNDNADINPFNTGETIDSFKANYKGTGAYAKGGRGPNRKGTTPVGDFQPNARGLFDMHGNVWEWCSDFYGEYPARDDRDPTGPADGHTHVKRGGAWDRFPEWCRTASRWEHPADMRLSVTGFRVCLDV